MHRVLPLLFLTASTVCAAQTPDSVMVTAPARTGTPRLMQGPMLGAVTPTSIVVWMRPAGPFACAVEYGTDAELLAVERSEAVRAEATRDYTVALQLKGLRPATRYYYRVLVDGVAQRTLPATLPCTFVTAPDPARPTRWRLAYGSCARIDADPEQPIWARVREAGPDLFVWIGDNVYANTVLPGMLREEYRRQRGVPSLQPLLRSVPHLAIWDDHDFGCNNDDGSNPIKHDSAAVFGEYWANPPRDPQAATGIYFQYSFGGVDMFFLDDRYHRSPNDAPDGPDKTMLGAAQNEWLRRGLRASKAPFKLLLCGSGWTKAKGPGGDSWASFLYERDALFDFVRDEQIAGVVLVSGDTHVAEANAIPRAAVGGYDLYDLVSSPLAQAASDNFRDRQPELRIRPPFAASANFGVIDFDLRETPTLRFVIVGVDGRPAWEPLELRAEELRNGVESWPRKIDRREYGRQLRAGVLTGR